MGVLDTHVPGEGPGRKTTSRAALITALGPLAERGEASVAQEAAAAIEALRNGADTVSVAGEAYEVTED